MYGVCVCACVCVCVCVCCVRVCVCVCVSVCVCVYIHMFNKYERTHCIEGNLHNAIFLHFGLIRKIFSH